MSAALEAEELEADVLAWMESAPAGFVAAGATRAARYGLDAAAGVALDARFEAMALRIFAYQFEQVPTYAAYARALGRTPGDIRHARDIPALPVAAFKQARIATFDAAHDQLQFHTSGTTDGQPGVLALASTRLYDSALRRGFRHHVLPDRDTIRVVSMVPDIVEAPHSSLAYMLAAVRADFGTPESTVVHRGGAFTWRGFTAALAGARAAGAPVCILGTGFQWLHVVDTCDREAVRFQLPPGSRAFETGGTKGRTRALDRDQLVLGIERCFAIPSTHVVGEYGMTEMGSQFYTLDLRQATLGLPPVEAGWSYPAWVRPRLMEAETGRCREMQEAREIGLLAHHDLANVGSAAHLLTADLGAAAGCSFALRGRAARADPRGCGLVHEHMDVVR